MRFNNLLISLLLTSCCIVSCEKADTNNDSESSETSNWWFRADMVSKGIKTIEEGDNVFHYDREGRLTLNEYPGRKLLYEYNSQGFISKKTILDTENDDEVITRVTYEYENIGKFIPNVTVAGLVTQLNTRGLLPNLSKIKVEQAQRTYSTEFKFHGDTLVISDNSRFDGKIDTVYVLYEGLYPYSTTSGTVGPITYQKNGMFSTFRTDMGYFFYKEDDRFMLLDKYSCYNSDQFKQYAVYTYDDRGNKTKIKWTEIYNDSSYVETTIISYKYDERGNWIERTFSYSYDPNTSKTETRKIEYWTN